jgi:hypothetical protein
MSDLKWHYDSITDWVLAGNGKNDHETSKHESADYDWDLGLGWDGWLDIAKNGWAEGMDQIRDTAREIRLPDELLESIQVKPERILAESGDEVEVGLMLTGEVECMHDWIPAEKQEVDKVVKIGLNLRLLGSMDAVILLRRAIGALAIANALEDAGYCVEICAATVQRFGGKKKTYTFECIVKNSDQRLDLADLSIVAHPAFKRRGWFAIGEQSSNPVVRRNCSTGEGYGTSKNPYPNPDGDILVVDEDWNSESELKSGVAKLIKKFFKV